MFLHDGKGTSMYAHTHRCTYRMYECALTHTSRIKTAHMAELLSIFNHAIPLNAIVGLAKQTKAKH